MDKKDLKRVEEIHPLKVPTYQVYSNPENQNVYEKVNGIIQDLHHMGRITNSVVKQWNQVMQWVVENGIEDITTSVLEEKLDVALNTDLRVLAETVTNEKISEIVESGQFEEKIEVAINSMHENIQGSLNGFTAQLAETATKTEVETVNQRVNNVIALPSGSTTNDARLEDIKIGADGVTYESPGDAVRGQTLSLHNELTKLKSDISTLVVSENLLNVNADDFATDFYIAPTTGVLSANAIYDTTGFIKVTPGMKIMKSHQFSGTRSKGGLRFIAAFNGLKTIIPTAGSGAEVVEYVIPQGVEYIRASYIKRSDITNLMISQHPLDYTSVPSYKDYFPAYYETKVTTDSTLSKANTPADSKAVGDAFANINRNIVPYKNPSDRKTADTLGANTAINIPSFPEMLKTGQVFSYTAKFDSFGTGDTLSIGFMNPFYATYQSWMEISVDRMKWLLSGTNAISNNLHGLTLSQFINVTVEISTDTGQFKVVINTLGQTYTFTQTSDSTRANAIGTLTAKATMPTRDVVLSGTCTQFKYHTWLVGDSYFGVGESRITGRLMEWKYSNGVLIDGNGGLNSQQGYVELQKLLNYGTPKTLVWYLGMNDNATTVANYFPLIEQLCDDNGIELVFNRIPYVPSRLVENKAVNDYVMASGRRYVDSYSAVGADVSGNWHAGFLHADGVHPAALGAAALTSRLIVDVPEILSASN